MLIWIIAALLLVSLSWRKIPDEMHRWSPAAISVWRFQRLLTATYWNVSSG
jgi:hypothetical protein